MGTPAMTASRTLRVAVIAVLLLLLAGPAKAAGTGGIEVTPLPSVVDGKPATAFRVDVPSSGSVEVPYQLRNVAEEERSARIYVAAVDRDENGTFSLLDPGSSRFASMDPQSVTLAVGESREESFTIRGGELPDDEQLAAVVVEVTNGSIVQRASTLIYFERGRQVPLPLLLVGAAVLLVVAAGAAFSVVARRRVADA